MEICMNTEQKALLELAGCALLGGSPRLEDLAKVDWNELYLLTVDAKINAIVYDVVSALSAEYAPPQELMKAWKNGVLAGALRQMKAQYAAAQIVKQFTESGIPYVVFKGPVLADLYPSSAKRFSKDLDILVSGECRDEAEKILREYPMQYGEVESKDCVSVWDIRGGLQIELHSFLWEEYEGSQVEHLKEMRLTEPQSLIQIESSIGPIVTMGHTQHLVYQMFHTIKHLLFKGIALRVFIDTALFINRYIEEIDVERFWICMDKLKYTRFCMNMFGVCEAYFQMDSRIYPQGRRAHTDSSKFLNQIMTACLRNVHDPVYNTASDAVFYTFLKDGKFAENSAAARSGRSGVVAKLLFPRGDYLPERYAYAKKCPILLPVAWIHRAGHKLLLERSGSSGLDNAQKSLSIAQQRTMLLQEYELID